MWIGDPLAVEPLVTKRPNGLLPQARGGGADGGDVLSGAVQPRAAHQVTPPAITGETSRRTRRNSVR